MQTMLRIVFATGHGASIHYPGGLEAAFLTKPGSVDELQHPSWLGIAPASLPAYPAIRRRYHGAIAASARRSGTIAHAPHSATC